jgi:hypothetical protein
VNGVGAISLQNTLGHSGLEMNNHHFHLASAERAAIQERVAPMDKLEIKPMKAPRKKWAAGHSGIPLLPLRAVLPQGGRPRRGCAAHGTDLGGQASAQYGRSSGPALRPIPDRFGETLLSARRRDDTSRPPDSRAR